MVVLLFGIHEVCVCVCVCFGLCFGVVYRLWSHCVVLMAGIVAGVVLVFGFCYQLLVSAEY